MILKQFVIFIFIPFLFACSSVTQLHQTPKGLILEPHEGTRLDLTYFAPELTQVRNRTVEVRLFLPLKTIDPAHLKIKQLKPEDWEEWRRNFQSHLADALYRNHFFKDVATPNDTEPLADPDLRFDFAMTEWHEGSGWKRFVIGFGAGQTTMQWEGALIDVRTKKPLFAFGDKRHHPGGPSMMGLNFRPFHGATLIAEDLRYGTQDLIATLREPLGVTAKETPDLHHPETHGPQKPAPAAAQPATPLDSQAPHSRKDH